MNVKVVYYVAKSDRWGFAQPSRFFSDAILAIPSCNSGERVIEERTEDDKKRTLTEVFRR